MLLSRAALGLLTGVVLLACSSGDASPTDTSTPSAGGQGGGGQGGSAQAGAGQGGSGGKAGSAAGSGGSAAGQGGSASGQAGEGQAGSEPGPGGSAGQGGSAQAGGGQGGSAAGSSGQGGSGAGQGGSGGQACVQEPRADDRERKVVVSHPFLSGGEKAKTFEVLTLSADGKLGETGQTFEMGTATEGEIVFTPDGSLGFAVDDKGKIGVFSLAGEAPKVIDPAYDAGVYATSVVMSPAGDRLYVLSNQWRNNGGGIYSVSIGCDGALKNEGLLAASKLPAGLVLLPEGRALLGAVDVLDSKENQSAHLIKLGDAPAVLGSADAFGDTDAIVSSVVVTQDGQYGLIADASEFSGKPNRIAVVRISADGLTPVQVMSPVDNPYALAASPFDNHALVVDGYGNALLSVSFEPASEAPFKVDGPLTYQGKKPALPGDLAMIRKGSLKGRVLVSETSGVRQVQFPPEGGAAKDLGLFSLGDQTTDITNAIGVQP